MNKSDNNTQKVVDAVDIVEVIGQFVTLQKSGSGYKGFSPFKSEKTPSFSVSPEKKIFKDFSTDVGGNVIKFYSLMKNMTYNEALVELAKKYNVNISLNMKEVEKYSLDHRILEDAMRYYCENLENSDVALNYLKIRNYTLDDVKPFKLGYASNSWDGLLNSLSQKYEIKELLKLGLIAKSSQNGDRYYDVFRDRIMIPIFNKSMQVVGFGGRYIGNEANVAKYINSKESEVFNKSNELYGIFDRGVNISKKDYVILTEGYFDVISSHINGYDVAVASLGTAFTEHQARLLKPLTKNVIIMYDNDEAGQKATKSAINILNSLEFNVKYVKLPDGIKDPDEFFKDKEEKDFFELLKTSVDAFEYVYGIESKNLDLLQVSSKKEVIDRMRPYFSHLVNNISFKQEASRLAIKLDVDREDILSSYSYVRKNKVRKGGERVNSPVTSYKRNDRDILERKIIEYLLYAKSRYRLNLCSFEIKNEVYRELNKKLSSQKYDKDSILNLVLSEEESKVLEELAFETTDIGDLECLRLYKSWLNIYISEINEKQLSIENVAKLRRIIMNIRTVDNMESLEKNFEEIIKIKGE